MTDAQLLQRFAAMRDEDAFAELVRRYSGLVHATALRILSDEHLAEDATQAVFLVLAQKAGTLSPQTVLSAWLYTAAWNAARNLGRSVTRRAAGERRAGMAQSQPTQDEKDRLLWEDVRGQLDGALHELSEPLRQAVVLRCLLQQTPEDCARSAGVSEKAFSMRLSRGLDALREKLTRRGVTLGSVLLADLIARHAVLSAPQTLQHALVATALGKAAATPPALFTAKGVVYAMFWTKAKTALIAVLVLLFVTGGTAIAYRCAVPAPVVPALKAATPPPAATVQPAAPAASQSAKVDLADVPRLNREPGQKAADGPVTKLAPEADQARERACEQISKVMGKQDVDWAIAKPLDPRLPANLRKRAYVGLPGNLQTVTVHPDHRYWITAIGIDLKDPSKSIWWEFEVNPDSVTERIRAPLAKVAAPAGDVQPAEQTEAKEF